MPKSYIHYFNFNSITLYFFTIFLSIFISSNAFAIDLPKTGQTTCYDSAGAVIPSCAGTGQDGEIQAGVTWPIPRFTDNLDGTVTDNLTGLIWAQDANAPGPVACSPSTTKTWQGALDYVACLNTNSYLGYTDWRLPNVLELQSLVNTEQSNSATWLNSQGFSNVQSYNYWSSTSYARYLYSAWDVGMWGGDMGFNSKSFDGFYVWPVRSFGSSVIQLPKTGQTTCYDSAEAVIACTGTGQDGEIQAGVAWPSSRFIDNSDGTVTDNLTGLIWTQDGNAPGPATCSTAVWKTWQDALNYVACLNTNSYLGYSDWRLPNVNELRSMMHVGQSDSSVWLNSQGFNNVQSITYWSSSSSASYPSNAWVVGLWVGYVGDGGKSFDLYYVWPVRTGEVGTIEICDGIDNDLNGLIDEGFPDSDSDGQADCVDTDDDNDGLSDSVETNSGTFIDPNDTGTDPLNNDTDGDGLPDGWEVQYGLNPLDSSGDNGVNGDPDGDGFSNIQEYQGGSNPSDWNSIPNMDTDLDGISDSDEITIYSTDPNNPDTDGDWIFDGYEVSNGLDPLVINNKATSDTDGDEWTDWQEFVLGTNASDPNSVPVPV
ncbi:MAG: DUF1566 domain-containing protein, partial [Nitrospirae bacterium]|nr:DUF1566 domain-containing protein [Nitrospirota bacterium]